ncbi:MAG: hypothetical protein GX130_12095 [Candidatus Hydrogenedens sp.]|nr:hypothetical protein [Candidatus Hydrogenedens sp.]
MPVLINSFLLLIIILWLIPVRALINATSRKKRVLIILRRILLLTLVLLLLAGVGAYGLRLRGETNINVILNRYQETTSHQEFLDLCRYTKYPQLLNISVTSEGIRMETRATIFGSYTCLFVEFLEEERLKLTRQEKNIYFTKEPDEEDNYLNRKEIVAFYNKLEPGMADMEVMTAFREMNPYFLSLYFTHSGYRVPVTGKIFGAYWCLNIECRDGYIQRLEIREGDPEKRPEKAPPDKVL